MSLVTTNNFLIISPDINPTSDMKKILLPLLLLLLLQTAHAQRPGAFRFQMDLGAAIPKEGGAGALLNLEPQVLVKNNIAVGLRFGAAVLAKEVKYYSISDEYEGEVGANVSAVGTVNYFFNNGRSRVAPYIGAGFGYYGLANVDMQDYEDLEDDEIGELTASFAWAPMLRAGIEMGKFRLGAEYNLVPKSDLQNVSGVVVGETINQYFGFTLGFFVGGGKWGK
jgi:outer membrane protein W